MASAKIKKGDKVIILSGKDRGKTGDVTKVMPTEGKVVVGGINMNARHRKPTQGSPTGGIDRMEAPLFTSKVALLDPKTGKATRVGFKVVDGKKVRVAKKSGEVISG
jgi:large subunit ribosomal protein L24